MEKEKDHQELMEKRNRQTAYRSILQFQEMVKAKAKLNTEIKIHNPHKHGGTADRLYTFGGTYVSSRDRAVNKEKGYIPPNPIVNPISDPMYNPYLRKDISEGINHLK